MGVGQYYAKCPANQGFDMNDWLTIYALGFFSHPIWQFLKRTLRIGLMKSQPQPQIQICHLKLARCFGSVPTRNLFHLLALD
jgi:hypothetical protein